MEHRRQCPEHGHALADVRCRESGETFTLRLPWEHRYDPVTWDDDEVVAWDDEEGNERWGIEIARGHRGIHTLSDGVVYKLDHGAYRHPKPVREVMRMEKAANLKPGERWITVHPNGPGTKGQAVLVSPNPDGTHSVIAGAGGRLQHLRLKGIKSAEEHESEKKEKAKQKRAEERERNAKLSPEERKTKKEAKEEIKAAKRAAERDYIDFVRERFGGVSEDPDESDWENLSEEAKQRLRNAAHRTQLTEANARARKAMEAEVEAGVTEARKTSELHEDLVKDHGVSTEMRELLSEELELVEEAAKERRKERLRGKGQQPASKQEATMEAARNMLPQINQREIDVGELLALGGHSEDSTRPATREPAPSRKQWRDATEKLMDAKIIAEALSGQEPTDGLSRKVLDKAKSELGITGELDEDARDKLTREAFRLHQQGELGLAKAKKLERLEGDGEDGYDKAARAYQYSARCKRIAEEVRDAKRQGLMEATRTPVTDPELAAYDELIRRQDAMRRANKEYRELTRRVEKGDYESAREAAEVKIEEADGDAVMSVEDQIRAELARGLRGMADRERPSFLSAHSAGAHDAMADVGLSVAKQTYVDRLTLDALGPRNTAVLLRHALTQDGHDLGQVVEALEQNQVKEANDAASSAIARADAFVPGLEATVRDVGDIETALAQIDAFEADLDVAQRSVGAALGRLETLATIAEELRKPDAPGALTVPFEGDGGLQRTLTYLQSTGLVTEGQDYVVDREAGKVSIPQAAWSKLITRMDPEQVKMRERVDAIKGGAEDEEGWLPPGFVSRAETTFTNPILDSPRYFEPLKLDADDMQGSLSSHIGSRLLDGEAPADVMKDLLSPTAMKEVPENKQTQYVNAVRELFPLVDADGNRRKYEDYSEHFEQIAAAHAQDRYGSTHVGINGQQVDLNDKGTQEAVFRTLAANPELKHAFVPLGDSTHEDRAQLRAHLYRSMGIDPKQHTAEAQYASKLEELGEKPAASQMGMFGGSGGEVAEWELKRDELLAKYPTASSGDAIRAMRDAQDGRRWLQTHLGRVFGAGFDADKVPTDPAKREALLEALAQPSQHQEVADQLFDKPEAAVQAALLLRDHARTPWQRFVRVHGSGELAYGAIQAEMRGRFAQAFADHHGRITGKPLAKGIVPVPNRERHLRATDPEKADEYLASLRSEYAGIRNREQGRFASEDEGGVRAKHDLFIDQSRVAEQNQLAMFGSGPKDEVTQAPELRGTLEAGERWTLGQAVENQIASVMPHLAEAFQAGKPVDVFPGASMDKDRVAQQRTLKMMEANGGRIIVAAGTGSGKTPMAIGGFTMFHDKGQARHGLFVVPSAVQQQFGQEMLTFTEPGKYRFKTAAGLTHEERVAMLADPSVHMKVMTHESFRDTAVQIMADHYRDGDASQMAEDFKRADPQTRAQWMREAFLANGIDPYYFAGDEAHRFTTRDPTGKQPLIHAVMQAASHPLNATQAMYGTATPVKNDANEAWSMASMADPERYGDRDWFMRNYGSDMAMNPTAIRRDTAHMVMTTKIQPKGVERVVTHNPRVENGRKVESGSPMALHPGQQKRVDRVNEVYDKIRAAREQGRVDVDAVRELSPHSLEGMSDEDAYARAAELQESAGIMRETAMRKAINLAPIEENSKLRQLVDVVKHDVTEGEWTHRDGTKHKGKPTIIFTDSVEEAQLIHDELVKENLRSAMYHGGMGSDERDAVMRGFRPKGGQEAKHDVMVVTSAGEAGLNAQRGKVQHNYDIPKTEKSWNQRAGRAYRQGQKGDVEVHDWVTDSEYDQRAQRRLRQKELLAEVWQDPVDMLDQTGIAGEYQRVLAHRHQDADLSERVA